MKRFHFTFVYLSCLLLVACTTNQATNGTEVPTRQEATTIGQPEVMVTTTATLIPATATNETLPTVSSIPTSLPTDIPSSTITPTPLLPPAGYIAYLSPIDDLYINNIAPTYELKAILPGTTPADWEVKTLLNNLIIPSIFPSSDGQKIVITQFKDANEDGSIRHWDELLDIFLYLPAQGSFVPLTNHVEFPPINNIQWLSGDESFTYALLNDLMQISVTDLIAQSLYTFPRQIFDYAWSPNEETVALFINTVENSILLPDEGQIVTYTPSTGSLTVVTEQVNWGKVFWSPDGNWLTYTERGKLILIDPVSHVQTIVFSSPEPRETISDWSPDGRWLAYIRDYDTALVWDTQTGMSIELYRGEYFQEDENGRWGELREINWLPDGSGFVLTVFDHEKARFVLIHPRTQLVQDLLVIERADYESRPGAFSNPNLTPELEALGWSPDGGWFLYFAEQEDFMGIYIIARDGTEIHPILATDLIQPNATWIPTSLDSS